MGSECTESGLFNNPGMSATAGLSGTIDVDNDTDGRVIMVWGSDVESASENIRVSFISFKDALTALSSNVGVASKEMLGLHRALKSLSQRNTFFEEEDALIKRKRYNGPILNNRKGKQSQNWR